MRALGYGLPFEPDPHHGGFNQIEREPVFAPQPSAAVLVALLGLWLAIIAAVAGGLYWMGVGA